MPRRKVIPALLFSIFIAIVISQIAIIAVDRSDFIVKDSIKSYRKGIAEFFSLPLEEKEWKKFVSFISYIKGNFKDSQSYQHLSSQMQEREQQWKLEAVRIFYLTTPPVLLPVISQYLHEVKLATNELNCLIALVCL